MPQYAPDFVLRSTIVEWADAEARNSASREKSTTLHDDKSGLQKRRKLRLSLHFRAGWLRLLTQWQ
jgi:hypothetical protein